MKTNQLQSEIDLLSNIIKIITFMLGRSGTIHNHSVTWSWLDGSIVERRSLIGELSLVCTGPAADG